ncbi:DJ-1/PfpI family protein [Bacteroidota bacterium]
MKFILSFVFSIIVLFTSCSEESNPSSSFTTFSYLRVAVEDNEGDLYRYGCISVVIELQGPNGVFADTLMSYIGNNLNAAFQIEKRNYDTAGEEIRITEICIRDFLFNVVMTDNENIVLNFGEQVERGYTIDAINTDRYWQLLNFDTYYNLTGKKVLGIVGRDFDASEYQIITNFLKFYGVELTTASYQLDTYGHLLLRVQGFLEEEEVNNVPIDMLISDVTIEDYDMLFFPGGRGPANMLTEYPEITDFVMNAYNSGILIGAICHGPLVLAESGILAGKNATAYPDVENAITSNGGTYMPGENVVVDGTVITGNWPQFYTMASTLAEMLQNL